MDHNYKKYISTYIEKNYIKYLSSLDLLTSLKENYEERYKKDGNVNGDLLSFLESLECYVINKLKTDKNFINSQYFNNYKNIIMPLMVENNAYFFQSKFPKEFDKQEMCKLLGENNITTITNSVIQKFTRVKEINDKISKNLDISQGDLNFICDVYAFNRDDNKNHEMLIEYIFNNLTKTNSSLKCSKFVLDAILSYIPKFYPKTDVFDPTITRFFSSDKNVDVGVAKKGICLLNRKIFQNILFDKHDDITKPYRKTGTDFTFLLVVANHELRHIEQKTSSNLTKYSDMGFEYAINNVLNEKFHDYCDNHDNDSIEIDATSYSWKVCSNFYERFIKNENLKQELKNSSNKNYRGTENRRFDFIKYDQKTGEMFFTSDYDIMKLSEALSFDNKIFPKYPILSNLYEPNGRISLNFIISNKFKESNVLSSHFMYLLLNYPRRVLNFFQQLEGENLEVAIDNAFQSFRTEAKKFIYFYYNKDNNLLSENLTFSDETKNEILEKNYQKMSKCFSYLKFIYGMDVLKERAKQIGRNLDSEIRSLGCLIETVEKQNNHISQNFKTI